MRAETDKLLAEHADMFGFTEQEERRPIEGLRDRFLFPPFSVLEQRSGEWQERKRRWLSAGIRSEIGRGENLLGMSDQVRAGGYAKALNTNAWLAKHADESRERLGVAASEGGNIGEYLDSGTSIFDPVLCEIAYKWFCPRGGQIIDPFAGGSVRGVTASALGYKYWGSELRAEQVEANRAQLPELAGALKLEGQPEPQWVQGDSREAMRQAPLADMLFSCPPYGDLERYSDDPLDLSTMEWPRFLEAYRYIIQRALARLLSNRFAIFVVGDYRSDRGFYRHFVAETVRAFEEADEMMPTRLYNHAILIQPVGSAAIRATKIFDGGRKLVKAHQDMLVFVKGDPERASQACREGWENV